ncbi:hypothetical protein HF329_00650 [Chitinophaga oryzae]|uniref:Uncharacterized protein n=1 Tax=Chitinophaga oryzae TaxID=2725414 RepID=A0AAE7D4V7_9BACT|nr:hypothetical protein [Chitinophaga oryzae]QJB29893.1 hypothetical protein HF329_00650 [Chitinophaga oryzae]
MLKFLALLPAILSFVGFIVYLIWRNNQAPSPILSEIINIVRSNSGGLPILDKRLTAKQTFDLINQHQELREKLTANDYFLLQKIVKSDETRMIIFAIICLIITAFSIFGYYKINQEDRRLVISDVKIKGYFTDKIYPLPTTKDDFYLNWIYKGEDEDVNVSVTVIESGKRSKNIVCRAKDGSLRIPLVYLNELWGCPTLSDLFSIRINMQTSDNLQTFGPFYIRPALTIQYYVNCATNKVQVWTQTMNCGLYQYSYKFLINAWEPH